jgi:hypothetical protein
MRADGVDSVPTLVSRRRRRKGRSLRIVFSFAAAYLVCEQTPARADVKVAGDDKFSVNLGLKIQSQLQVTNIDPPAGVDWTRDFYVRRMHFKMSGNMLTCGYNLEVKVDNINRINPEAPAIDGTSRIQHAFIICPLAGDFLQIRTGISDAIISREFIIGDEKQLALDRGIVFEDLNSGGLVDNVIGVTLMGALKGGLLQYSAGAYDNRTIAGEDQKYPMYAGRLNFNFLSKDDPYKDTHFGDGRWLSVGVNGSYQSRIFDTTAMDNSGVRWMYGVDAMADLPLGPGRLFLRAELDRRDFRSTTMGDEHATLWLAGAGYLFQSTRVPVQLFYKASQRIRTSAAKDTYLEGGVTIFFNQHNLKLVADAIKQLPNTHSAIDQVRIQFQVEF